MDTDGKLMSANELPQITGDAGSSYLMLRDLEATHNRRVRIMVLAASAFLVLIGSSFALFYAIRHDWLTVSVELFIIVIGITSTVLVRRGQLRLSVFLLVGSLFFAISAMAIFMDITSVHVPRAVHNYLIPLAVASYLMMKNERNWLRLIIPLACFAAFVVFASTNFGIVTRLAIPDSARSPSCFANNIFAMGTLGLMVHIFMSDINRMEMYLHSANNRFVSLVISASPKNPELQ